MTMAEPTGCPSCGEKWFDCGCKKVREPAQDIQSARTPGYNAALQDSFGFVDEQTKCFYCGGLLNRENAHWAFGKWYHRLVDDCAAL